MKRTRMFLIAACIAMPAWALDEDGELDEVSESEEVSEAYTLHTTRAASLGGSSVTLGGPGLPRTSYSPARARRRTRSVR